MHFIKNYSKFEIYNKPGYVRPGVEDKYMHGVVLCGLFDDSSLLVLFNNWLDKTEVLDSTEFYVVTQCFKKSDIIVRELFLTNLESTLSDKVTCREQRLKNGIFICKIFSKFV